MCTYFFVRLSFIVPKNKEKKDVSCTRKNRMSGCVVAMLPTFSNVPRGGYVVVVDSFFTRYYLHYR
jgi:hypothetical protein